MEVTQSFEAPINIKNAVNDVKSKDLESKQQTNYATAVITKQDQVTISPQGEANQQIDALFDKADAIYQSHITPNQQKTLDESYQKLDALFSSHSPTEKEQDAANTLFDKIDNIFNQAEKQLTPAEQEQLANIDIKLDELLGTDDTELENVFNDESERLFQQSEDLLTSRLSTQQKKKLDELNDKLNSLFESINPDDKKASVIFDKIDSILNQGYDKLSTDEKQKLEGYDNEIEQLFKTLDSKENNGKYY
jgi:hypothetical protein